MNSSIYSEKIDWSKYEKCQSQCSGECLVIDLKIKFIGKQCLRCYLYSIPSQKDLNIKNKKD